LKPISREASINETIQFSGNIGLECLTFKYHCMKSQFILIAGMFIFTACSTDYDGSLDGSGALNSSSGLKIGDDPRNDNNPYDVYGALYLSLEAAFITKDTLPKTYVSLVTDLSALIQTDSLFTSIQEPTYQLLSERQLNKLQEYLPFYDDFISGTSFSPKEKYYMNVLLRTVAPLYEMDTSYVTIHEAIVGVEVLVATDVVMTSAEKQTVFVLSSLFRHATYAKRKRPKKNTDPEWDLLIVHFLGSVEGLSYGGTSAITGALLMEAY
jgi:hypothetical protein